MSEGVELLALDKDLITALECEDIRVVRTSWILGQPLEYRMQRRQDLELLDGEATAPLLRGNEAAELVKSGKRAVGVVS